MVDMMRAYLSKRRVQLTIDINQSFADTGTADNGSEQ